MLASTDSGGSVGRMRKRGMAMIGEHSPTWTRERRYTKKCIMMSSISFFFSFLVPVRNTPHQFTRSLTQKGYSPKEANGTRVPKKGHGRGARRAFKPHEDAHKKPIPKKQRQEFAVDTPKCDDQIGMSWRAACRRGSLPFFFGAPLLLQAAAMAFCGAVGRAGWHREGGERSRREENAGKAGGGDDVCASEERGG